jgi:hypothetical protein
LEFFTGLASHAKSTPATDALLRKIAIAKLQPVLEPRLEKLGISWNDLLPILQRVDSVDELIAGYNNPDKFVTGIVDAVAAGQLPSLAQRALIKSLQPLWTPILDENDDDSIAWSDVEPVLASLSVSKLERVAANQSESVGALKAHALTFLKELASHVANTPVAEALLRKIAVAHRRATDPAWRDLTAELKSVWMSALRNASSKYAMTWSDVEPVLEQFYVEELKQVVEKALLAAEDLKADPLGYLKKLVPHDSSEAKKYLQQLALAKLRPVLEPPLEKNYGMSWMGFMPVLELVDAVGEFAEAYAHPEQFLKKLRNAPGDFKRRALIAKLRSSLAPILAGYQDKLNVTWLDIKAVLEELDVEELDRMAVAQSAEVPSPAPSQRTCDARLVQRRRRNINMCSCRRRSDSLCDGDLVITDATSIPKAPAPAPSQRTCDPHLVQRRRRNTNMCSCRRRSDSLCNGDLVITDAPPITKACEYTEERCRVAALALGLQLGTTAYPFAGEFSETGCYAFSSGDYAGTAFYGYLDGGGEVQIESELTQVASPKLRLAGTHDCAQADNLKADPIGFLTKLIGGRQTPASNALLRKVGEARPRFATKRRI